MPVDWSQYPPNWKEISRGIKEAACWRCQGSPAYPDCRAEHGKPHPETGAVVVITVAHLDHNEANCDPANLRAMCQRCHNTYDAAHRAANRARTRRQKQIEAGQLELLTLGGLEWTPSLKA